MCVHRDFTSIDIFDARDCLLSADQLFDEPGIGGLRFGTGASRRTDTMTLVSAFSSFRVKVGNSDNAASRATVTEASIIQGYKGAGVGNLMLLGRV